MNTLSRSVTGLTRSGATNWTAFANAGTNFLRYAEVKFPANLRGFSPSRSARRNGFYRMEIFLATEYLALGGSVDSIMADRVKPSYAERRLDLEKKTSIEADGFHPTRLIVDRFSSSQNGV
jgi:hypothetical protein